MNQNNFKIQFVHDQLQEYPLYLHVYLHSLFMIDQTLTNEYHPIQLVLYSEYDRANLHHFLSTSTHYNPRKVSFKCTLSLYESKGYWHMQNEESVF